jgi:hypothetical protein
MNQTFWWELNISVFIYSVFKRFKQNNTPHNTTKQFWNLQARIIYSQIISIYPFKVFKIFLYLHQLASLHDCFLWLKYILKVLLWYTYNMSWSRHVTENKQQRNNYFYDLLTNLPVNTYNVVKSVLTRSGCMWLGWHKGKILQALHNFQRYSF